LSSFAPPARPACVRLLPEAKRIASSAVPGVTLTGADQHYVSKVKHVLFLKYNISVYICRVWRLPPDSVF
jgi:hypothetical protein